MPDYVLCSQDVCGHASPELYDDFKAWCDRYFYIPCREVMRHIAVMTVISASRCVSSRRQCHQDQFSACFSFFLLLLFFFFFSSFSSSSLCSTRS